MASPTRILGFSEEYGSWNTICAALWKSRSSLPLSDITSFPSKKTAPAALCSSLNNERPNVVFPQPDSPTSPRVSPGKTSKLTSSTALTLSATRLKIPFLKGNHVFSPRTLSKGSRLYSSLRREARSSSVITKSVLKSLLLSHTPSTNSFTVGRRLRRQLRGGRHAISPLV